MDKILSIIIPFYNSGKTLNSCLQSLQSIFDKDCVEIILVDDGSEDNSLRIAKTFKSKHKNTILVHLDSNKGVSFARNTGLKIAKGKYILFLDSDDKLLKADNLLDILNTKKDLFIFGRVVYKDCYKKCEIPYNGNISLTNLLDNYLSIFLMLMF